LVAAVEQRHPGGRPRKYQDPTQLQILIDQYFAKCDATIIQKQVVQKGQIILVPTPEPYTMAGLAAHLEIDRRDLLKYSEYEEFVPVIAQARRKIEVQNINLGLVGCHDSRLAALNLASNYGYSENKAEVNVQVNVAMLQDGELEAKLARLVEKVGIDQLKQLAPPETVSALCQEKQKDK
jgi:hypothetical protein